jgi:hypothetical protein
LHDVDIAEYLWFLLTFYAGPYNSVRATLEGWRSTIRAEVAAEKTYYASAAEKNWACILCSKQVHSITRPAHNFRNQARQQQAEEEERGQRLEKLLTGAAAF